MLMFILFFEAIYIYISVIMFDVSFFFFFMMFVITIIVVIIVNM